MKRSSLGCASQWAAAACLSMALAGEGAAQTPATPPDAAQSAEPLFAIEIRTGPAWDLSKPPQDQAHFREHSTHLRRLREQGALVMGARYGDKGLLVLRAASTSAAHALMNDDPSLKAGVFRYELNELRVFYAGTLAEPPRHR